MAPRGQNGFHVDVKGIGRAHLAEVLIKPGRRRLTLMRLELSGRTMPHMGSDGADLATAAAQTKDAVLLTRSGPGGDGSMSVGSVEGNGTNTWP